MTQQERQKLIEQYKDGYRVVAEALIGLEGDELDVRPAPGKWSAKEIVHRERMLRHLEQLARAAQ